MKIVRYPIKTKRLDEFADEYGLILEIHERRDTQRGSLKKYFVNFPNVEVLRGAFLESLYGQGDTEWDAVVDYTKNLSGKPIVIDAYKKTRTELYAPKLTAPITCEADFKN